jgi:preprotein translocase subunit SecA
MDYLQEGIGMRALAQRDPLVEYQREGFDMFSAMMEGIKEESVGYLFNLEVQVEQQVEEVPLVDAPLGEGSEAAEVSLEKTARPEIKAKGLEVPMPQRLHYTAPMVDGDDTVVEGDFEGDFEDGVQDEAEGDGLTRAERRKAAKSAKGRRRK